MSHISSELTQLTVREVITINDEPEAEIIGIINNLDDKNTAIQNILSVKKSLQQSPSLAFTSTLSLTQLERTLTGYTGEITQIDLQVKDWKVQVQEIAETLSQIEVLLSTTQQEQIGVVENIAQLGIAHQDLQTIETTWQSEIADLQILFEELTK